MIQIKRAYLLTCCILALAGSVPAEAQKPIRVENSAYGYITYTYDAQGRITEMKSVMPSEDGDEDDVSLNTWTYSADKVESTDSYTMETTLFQTSVIENGKIVQESQHDETNNSQAQRYYTYDEQNRLIAIRTVYPYSEQKVMITWANGDVVKAETYQGSNKISETIYTASTVTMVPELAFCSSLFRIIDEDAVNPSGPCAIGLYGVLPQHLMAHESSHFNNPTMDADYITSFEYVLRGNQRVDKIIMSDSDQKGLEFKVTWDDDATGIAPVASASATDTYINLQGVQSKTPHKGLNIVRHSDGSCTKMIF